MGIAYHSKDGCEDACRLMAMLRANILLIEFNRSANLKTNSYNSYLFSMNYVLKFIRIVTSTMPHQFMQKGKS